MNDSISIPSILETALLAAGEPLTVERMLDLFDLADRPTAQEARAALAKIAELCEQERPYILKEIASGFCFQAKQEYAPWVKKLWEERPARYSRALHETLALIAYRQPITRAEIEDIRGVAVNTNTIKTLMDREWIRVVGHRDVPGKPAIYATTKQFLDYFNLKSLADLPSLTELQQSDVIDPLAQVEMDMTASITTSSISESNFIEEQHSVEAMSIEENIVEDEIIMDDNSEEIAETE